MEERDTPGLKPVRSRCPRAAHTRFYIADNPIATNQTHIISILDRTHARWESYCSREERLNKHLLN
jgi:hypothetical protein